ncbi:MAG: C39 family peptidase [Roseburia sp.]|nr:C39 family peptidase [Roseburia sp.]
MKNIKRKSCLYVTCFISLIYIAVSILFGFSISTAKGRYSSDGIMPYAAVSSEVVNFTDREETYEETVNGVPIYYQSSQLPNSCGPTAGAIVVGFYDKYYENLIPDFNPCLSSGKYKRADKVYIPQLMSDLYTLMRTNVDDVGVSETDCLNGLSTYVRNHDRTIAYNQISVSRKVNEAMLITAIHNNCPSLLFCSKMDVYNVSSGSGSDTIVKSAYTGAHVAVAYGLYTVKYYNGSTNFRTDKYIMIATGFSDTPSGYLRISATDWCDDAFAVSIA